MSMTSGSMQRTTQVLLAILSIGVWGLLLRSYLPIRAAAARTSPTGQTGGVVTAKLRNDDITNFTFDCTYQMTDCIRMWKEESADGTRLRESFDIFDRRPYTGRVESTQGVQRISLSDRNQNAQLVISDARGRPRIRIGVDKAGQPSMVMLNPDGKVVYRAGK